MKGTYVSVSTGITRPQGFNSFQHTGVSQSAVSGEMSLSDRLWPLIAAADREITPCELREMLHDGSDIDEVGMNLAFGVLERTGRISIVRDGPATSERTTTLSVRMKKTNR